MVINGNTSHVLCVCFARRLDISGAGSLHAWGIARVRTGRKIAKQKRERLGSHPQENEIEENEEK